MKRAAALFLLIAFLIPWPLSSQVETRHAKAYKNFYDFKTGKVLFDKKLKFFQAYDAAGHEEFDIKPYHGNVKFQDLKHEVWLVEDSDYIYLNQYRQGYISYKARFLRFQKGHHYYYFTAEPRQLKGGPGDFVWAMPVFGAFEALIFISFYDLATEYRLYHFFNLDDGTTYRLTRDVISDLLKDYPSAQNEFDNYRYNYKIDYMIKYLQIADSLRINSDTAAH